MSTIALDVRNLTRRFGARVAVDDLSISIKKGDIYGFLGPNGAGKTTAMRCMLGLIGRDSGEVTVFGESDPVRSRRSVGAMIEAPAFHSWLSGRKNLLHAARLIGLSDPSAEIDRVLGAVGLSERADDLTRGYSMGMKQRLGLARALLGGPRLLFLDEPTNGLDPSGVREVRDLIRRLALADGLTVFISSHILSEIQALCNRVGIIQNGQLRAEGNVSDLLAQDSSHRLVELDSPNKAELLVALKAIPEITILGAGQHGRTQVLYGQMPLEQLNRALLEAKVPLSALVPIERSLEDVFMEVTR